MGTQIAPMLAVSDPAAAIDFYRAAFGAEVLWQIGDPAEVAGLRIDGAQFFLARETPARGTRSPGGAGHTTVRIELFVDDPAAVQTKAIAAGARAGSPVTEHRHELTGGAPLRMLQGGVVDPFGHVWLIGRFLDSPII
jgi:PhnB protein